jgi:hypothetical protein
LFFKKSKGGSNNDGSHTGHHDTTWLSEVANYQTPIREKTTAEQIIPPSTPPLAKDGTPIRTRKLAEAASRVHMSVRNLPYSVLAAFIIGTAFGGSGATLC